MDKRIEVELMNEEEKESWEKYCNELNEEITEKNNKIFDLETQIEKLQKENEDLQREKEENKLIIAMANNEMLGYNQGYSDAENKNSNATEIIMKNRQAYIHKEEVEFYKRKIEFLKKENEEKDRKIKRLNNTNKSYKGIINKQNKQIDLMAEMIDELSEYYTRYNGKNNEFCKEVCIKKDIDCIDCIKQYFETKAKKGE